MSAEVMGQIRAAEDQAEELKQNARTKAKLIIADARAEGGKKLSVSVSAAKEQAEQLKRAALEEAKKKYENIIENANIESRTIENSGRENMEKAVDIIVGRIVNSQ